MFVLVQCFFHFTFNNMGGPHELLSGVMLFAVTFNRMVNTTVSSLHEEPLLSTAVSGVFQLQIAAHLSHMALQQQPSVYGSHNC